MKKIIRYMLWCFLIGVAAWLIFAFSDNKTDVKKEQRQIIINRFSA